MQNCIIEHFRSSRDFLVSEFPITVENDRLNFYERNVYQPSGILVNDKREGYWVIKIDYSFPPSVYIKRGHYKNGRQEGKWTVFVNGKLETIEHYKDGKLDGRVIIYLGDMKIDQIYKNGRSNGLKKFYDLNGKLIRMENWINGRLIN